MPTYEYTCLSSGEDGCISGALFIDAEKDVAGITEDDILFVPKEFFFETAGNIFAGIPQFAVLSMISEEEKQKAAEALRLTVVDVEVPVSLGWRATRHAPEPR